MKKKILILAAIAVSGIAAVVASNTNAFVGDAEAAYTEWWSSVGCFVYCNLDVDDDTCRFPGAGGKTEHHPGHGQLYLMD